MVAVSLARYVVRRVGFAVVSAFAVLTALFALFAFVSAPTPGTVSTGTPPGSPSDGSIPLLVRYVTWLERFLTLEWGQLRSSAAISILESTDATTVRGIVGSRLVYTATYAVPGLVAAVVVGTLVGYDTAANDGVRDTALRVLSYAALGLPTVVVALILLRLGLRDLNLLSPALPAVDRPAWEPYNLVRLLVPAALVTTATVGATARHARSQFDDRLDTAAVRLVRAKGGGYLTVGRHVIRASAAQLAAAVVAETLGILLLAVVMIEIVFQIGGFGRLLLFAAVERQPTLVAAITVVVALAGIGGNLLADLLRVFVDPRTLDEG